MLMLTKTNDFTGRTAEVELTDALASTIASQNEYMTADEVRSALLAGKVVCTEMSSYKLVGAPTK